jgi:hypothetical protein
VGEQVAVDVADVEAAGVQQGDDQRGRPGVDVDGPADVAPPVTDLLDHRLQVGLVVGHPLRGDQSAAFVYHGDVVVVFADVDTDVQVAHVSPPRIWLGVGGGVDLPAIVLSAASMRRLMVPQMSEGEGDCRVRG